MTKLCHDRHEFFEACDSARRSGADVGLVPTMGALHAGHLSLVAGAKQSGCDFVALSVFVNPLQFGEGEDLERYPRTLAADLEACRGAGVDLVFAPASDAMYPDGFQTQVRVTELTTPLEGQFRPGHFDGVTTVVAKLFAETGPCRAYFGRKDFQQWRVIERMTRDLGLPVDVVGMPIVRESDSLALSSRNRYLTPDERARALSTAAGLRDAYDAYAEGERDAETLLNSLRERVEATFDRVDYVALADAETLTPLSGAIHKGVLLAAAHLGGTRLIDNLWLGVDARP